ncbi:hypothetical protein AB0395_42500 [Streptosporangium sp. NPDC051023]|uniref:hypothetical protein n=1 Tax=Streptosporangium sp. NPDC051023 TaxID=3155410 RepID=UPI00344D8F76
MDVVANFPADAQAPEPVRGAPGQPLAAFCSTIHARGRQPVRDLLRPIIRPQEGALEVEQVVRGV